MTDIQGFDPEKLSRLVELLPNAPSLRWVARELGSSTRAVRAAAKPFIDLMRLSGTLADCECGRPRFHQFGCLASRKISSRSIDDVPGRFKSEWNAVHLRRKVIIDMIMAGDRWVDIAMIFGICGHSVRSYKRFMSPEQLEIRSRNQQLKNSSEPMEAAA